MEGLLDHSLRDTLTRVGGIDLCVSEFIRVTDAVLPKRAFYRVVPELLNEGKTHAGVPVRAQLLGSDPEVLAAYDEKVAGFKVMPLPADPKSNTEFLAWLNKDGAGQQIQLIDPSPAKMMVFPVSDSPKEFGSMKKDLEKLLRLNRKGEKLQ